MEGGVIFILKYKCVHFLNLLYLLITKWFSQELIRLNFRRTKDSVYIRV